MKKPRKSRLTSAQWALIGTIISALLGALALIISGIIQKTPPTATPSPPLIGSIEYVGRVLDDTTQKPVPNAKVSLEFQGAPPIVYTDAEGVYRFMLKLDEEQIKGQVRVEAKNYEIYERFITIYRDSPSIEDIRLSPKPGSGKLDETKTVELVDVTVIEEDDPSTWYEDSPRIDLKLRNPSNEIAFLKKVEFHIKDSLIIAECGLPFTVQVSQVYDVQFPALPPKKPYVITANISQAIGANDVDRFQFRIATDGKEKSVGHTVYLLELVILYNAGTDNKLMSDEILVMVPYRLQEVTTELLDSGQTVAQLEELLKESEVMDKPWSTEVLGYDPCDEIEKTTKILSLLDLPGIRGTKVEQLKVDSFIQRGIQYERAGKYDLALADFNQAILLAPVNASAYQNRGDTYYRQGNMELAIKDYTQAIEIDPAYEMAYANRGVVYYEQHNYDLALKDFNQSISLAPNDPISFYNRGNIYYYQGDYESAIRDYSQAIQLKPDYSIAYCTRGYAYLAVSDREHAIADFKHYLEIGDDPYWQQQVEGQLRQLDALYP